MWVMKVNLLSDEAREREKKGKSQVGEQRGSQYLNDNGFSHLGTACGGHVYPAPLSMQDAGFLHCICSMSH